MTAPWSFQFPNAQPTQPGPFIPGPTGGDQLQSGIAGLIKAMASAKELQMQQQQLDQQQQEYASVQKERGVRTEGLQQELQARQQALKAAQAGLGYYQQFVGGGGDFKNFGTIAAKISDPATLQAFANMVKEHLSTINTGAEATSHVANAKVDEATAPARIQQANLQPQVTQGTIAQTAASTQLTNLQAREAQDRVRAQGQLDATIKGLPPDLQGGTRSLVDFARAGVPLPPKLLPVLFPKLAELQDQSPEKVNAFKSVFATGQFTAGQSARIAGITLPSTVDTNAIAPKPGSTNAMTQRNEQLLPSLVASDKLINDQVNSGTRLGGIPAFFRGVMPTGMGNALTPANQQQLLTQGKIFATAWQTAFQNRTSPQMLKDVEKMLVPQPNDNDKTLSDKAVMRQIAITAMKNQQNSTLSPTDVLNQAIQSAKAMGVSTEGMQFLQRQRAAAQAARNQPQTIVPSATDKSPGAYADTLNAFNFGDSRP